MTQTSNENTKLLIDIQERLNNMDQHCDRTEEIFVILRGNGDPTTGMMWQLSEVHRWMQEHKADHRAQVQTKKEHTWDIVRGIIMMIVPAILVWLGQVMTST